MSDPSTLTDALLSALRPLGTPARADGERRYLRSDLTHLGVAMPGIRSVVRAHLDGHPGLDGPAALEAAPVLWAADVYELRQAAVLLLERRRRDLGTDDLHAVEDLLREAHTWALVDPLAIKVVGDIALRDAAAWRHIDRWVTDREMWLRRSALLAHLPALRADLAAFPRFAAHADALLDEREFFIRKAIGWVLREVAKRDSGVVRDWLEPRMRRASGVTRREALTYLPEADRSRLAAAAAAPGRGGAVTP